MPKHYLKNKSTEAFFFGFLIKWKLKKNFEFYIKLVLIKWYYVVIIILFKLKFWGDID